MVKSSYFAGQCLSRRPGCPGPVQVFRSPDPWRRRTPSSSSHDPGWTAAAAAEAVYTRMIDQRENFIILHLFQLRKHSFGQFILRNVKHFHDWPVTEQLLCMVKSTFVFGALFSTLGISNFSIVFFGSWILVFRMLQHHKTDDSKRHSPSKVGLLFSVQ